jgi:DHA1 family tetracycline resistance protein-like MFS transporter
MLLATPVLGRMSDRFGRKPILIFCMFGLIVGYLILGFASNLWWLALARLVQGAVSGNISVVQAYMADITSEENRAKGMGIIGAAIGLGFVLGPSIGSYLGGDSFESASLFLPAMVSASMSLISLLLVIFVLKESLPFDERLHDGQAERVSINPFAGMSKIIDRSLLLKIILAWLIFNLASGLVETIFPVWIKGIGIIDGPSGMWPIFLCAGLSMAIIQGAAVGPMARKFGEHRLLKMGAVVYGLSLIATAMAGNSGSYLYVVMAMTLQYVAMAFVITPMQSLASMRASESERGWVMGVFSSVGTIGRFVGPLTTGLLYELVDHNAPFYVGAILCLVVLVVILMIKKQAKKEGDLDALGA